MSEIKDNTQSQRFEMEVDAHVVYADYRREGADTLVIRYVEAPPALRGTGAAGQLMQGIVNIAQAENREIVPLCGYAAAWLKRHS